MLAPVSSVKRTASALLLALSLSACVGGAYSGPIEVTRFASEANQGAEALGKGPIAISFPQEMSNERAKEAFYNAVAVQLVELGYSIAQEEGPDFQTARVTTSRSALARTGSRSPVSVGVGGRTGSYGSGIGVGLGIDLGSTAARPSALTQLSVRISDANGQSLWEGRASQAISINSPYADVDASARALTTALFKDFPGGDEAARGESVTIELDELQDTQ